MSFSFLISIQHKNKECARNVAEILPRSPELFLLCPQGAEGCSQRTRLEDSHEMRPLTVWQVAVLHHQE